MNLSQPAVSRLISNLEHELGFTLFHRDRRALRPTQEGQRFFRETERILARMEQLADIAPDTLLQQQIKVAFTVTAVEPRVGMCTSSSLIAVNLVAQGFGYTITDRFTASCVKGSVVIRPLKRHYR
ncbi:LysR family transcriptional regulator [Sulfitobacter algicola]|uniref:LysR family transcriptional regulator n=1 Tax=Parasulfitobacter algicola TaxID=2614809 RepID=A0ABX2ILF6_9RHOB|nr:LysR family transcriptional regulator [Sulfitobacter algicola]